MLNRTETFLSSCNEGFCKQEQTGKPLFQATFHLSFQEFVWFFFNVVIRKKPTRFITGEKRELGAQWPSNINQCLGFSVLH